MDTRSDVVFRTLSTVRTGVEQALQETRTRRVTRGNIFGGTDTTFSQYVRPTMLAASRQPGFSFHSDMPSHMLSLEVPYEHSYE